MGFSRSHKTMRRGRGGGRALGLPRYRYRGKGVEEGCSRVSSVVSLSFGRSEIIQ